MKTRNLCLLSLALAAGCEAPVQPPAAKTPKLPPPVSVTTIPETPKPPPATVPPALVAKVDELSAIYKEMQQQATAPVDPNDPEAIEKRLKAAAEYPAKIQKVLGEITTAEALLSPEERAEFVKQYQSKLIPPTLPVPTT